MDLYSYIQQEIIVEGVSQAIGTTAADEIYFSIPYFADKAEITYITVIANENAVTGTLDLRILSDGAGYREATSDLGKERLTLYEANNVASSGLGVSPTWRLDLNLGAAPVQYYDATNAKCLHFYIANVTLNKATGFTVRVTARVKATDGGSVLSSPQKWGIQRKAIWAYDGNNFTEYTKKMCNAYRAYATQLLADTSANDNYIYLGAAVPFARLYASLDHAMIVAQGSVQEAVYSDNAVLSDITADLTGTGQAFAAFVAAQDKIYVGLSQKTNGLNIVINSANALASVMTTKYWNGLAFAALASTDNTANGGASLAVDGVVTWAAPAAWTADTAVNAFAGAGVTNLYWIELTFSGNLTAATEFIATGAQTTTSNLVVEYLRVDNTWQTVGAVTDNTNRCTTVYGGTTQIDRNLAVTGSIYWTQPGNWKKTDLTAVNSDSLDAIERYWVRIGVNNTVSQWPTFWGLYMQQDLPVTPGLLGAATPDAWDIGIDSVGDALIG